MSSNRCGYLAMGPAITQLYTVERTGNRAPHSHARAAWCWRYCEQREHQRMGNLTLPLYGQGWQEYPISIGDGEASTRRRII
jgi:hypothetical protein